MLIDGMHIDNGVNQLVQCLIEPHRNLMVLMAAPSPKTIHEQLETFVCRDRDKIKEFK